MISFTVEIVPVAKGRPRFARIGKFVRTYTPGKTLAYESVIALEAKKNRTSQPLSGPLDVSITFYMPIPASRMRQLSRGGDRSHSVKPDLDNLLKAALDPCNGILWEDDAQIYSIKATKVYSLNPRIYYEITQKDNAPSTNAK